MVQTVHWQDPVLGVLPMWSCPGALRRQDAFGIHALLLCESAVALE